MVLFTKKFWQSIEFWQKITAGLILGVIVGVIFEENAIILKPVGDIFIRLIKMIIVPLIYLSIVIGMTGIQDSSSLSRLSLKSIIAFLSTTSFAIVIGLATAYLLKPGLGINLEALGFPSAESRPESGFDVVALLYGAIPDNALNALVSGKLLQVVFFSFFTGIIINQLGREKKPIVKGFQLAAKVVFKMIHLILKLAPYAAFALIASIVGTQGIGAITNLGMLIFSLITAMSVQYLIFGLMIFVFARLSPIPFYKKSIEYQSLAFSTSSSKATLATTMDVCSNKLGISKSSTSFVLPLGAAINMDGMAIYLGICTLFFAQAYNIDLSTVDYFVIILTSTLGSIGAAGMPSGTIIMLPMVLSAVGIPIEGVAFIAGIDRILDMMRTTLNITGDATITLLVDASENTLNKKIYNTESHKLPEGEEGESKIFEKTSK
jgi:Na+/H+-dicarboxylate symporter